MIHRSAGAFIVLVALLAIGGATFWWRQVRVDSASRPKNVALAGSSVGVAPAASPRTVNTTPPDGGGALRGTMPRQAAPAFDMPLPEGPIGDTYAELVQRANAGDARAAMALAHTLALCIDYAPDRRGKLEDDLVEFAALAYDSSSDRDGSSRDRFIDLALGVLDRRDAACPGIENLGLEDRAAERDRWFTSGLELGHSAALVQEANDMLKTRYPRRADIINHAEELRALRPQAMAMLQRAAAQGEPIALLRTATAHHSGDLAERDPVAAYAYLLAYRAGPPATDVPQIMSDDIERGLAADLSAEQIRAAEARAAQIRARCCAGG